MGTAKVEADGSARFIVPAKVPILFQVLDGEGRAWRTMRSATSLMPGERVSCVGCHEPKREASRHAATVSEAVMAVRWGVDIIWRKSTSPPSSAARCLRAKRSWLWTML